MSAQPIHVSAMETYDHSGDDWSATPSGESEDDPVQEQGAMQGTKASRAADGMPELHVSTASTVSATSDRRTSIQLTFQKSGKKGRYVLTPDDPEIREVLKNGLYQEYLQSEGRKRPRRRFADLVFTRQFTTFDRQNPMSSENPFFGWFTLFWIAMALLLIRVGANNWRTYGTIFGGNEILHMMFDRDVIVLGLTDGAMWVTTTFGLILQWVILRGWITFDGAGWIIEHVWQAFYLAAVIGWTIYRQWPWTHTIFTVLHCIVFMMKQHSYTFYNGYLSQVYRRKRLLEQKLDQLENIEPVASPTVASPDFFPPSAKDNSGQQSLRHRRKSIDHPRSTNLKKEKSEIASIAEAMEAGQPLEENQLEAFKKVMQAEVDSLTEELQSKRFPNQKQISYPDNLTLSNFIDWTCLPTLVYELDYPRQERRDWLYIAEKSAATLGCIVIMQVISQAYIYPPVAATVAMKESGMTLAQRWEHFPWILNDMLFPMLLEQLLAWFVIWECLLNVLAEVTLFADRGFYGPWWNSVSWDEVCPRPRSFGNQ
jgi:sterol O-acyltransferase